MKKSSSFAIADEYLKSSTAGVSFMPLTGEQTAVDQIINCDDKVVAVLIDSTILGAPIWFAFDESFDPGDDTPVFYGDELDCLKDKPATIMRKIYETKRAFGLKTRVRQ
jgi:hypothetical protein